MTERLFCHCGPFFPSDAPNNPKNQNLKKWRKKKKMHEILSFYTCIPQMTIIWYIVPEIWSATDRILSHFGTFFALLPHNNTEKQNLKIIKKKPRDIILHKWTKNYDHMLYCSCDMVGEDCNCYFSFWAIFCPFTLEKPKKSNFPLKKWKADLEV